MKKKEKIAKSILPPYKAQKAYEKELIKFIEQMEKQTNKRLKRYYDDTEGILGFILSYAQKIPLFKGIVSSFISIIDKTHKKKFDKSLESIGFKEIIEPDLQLALDTARAKNVALVKSIPEQLHDRLELKLKDFFENSDGKNLQKIIEREFSVTKSRAKLIARDQTAKINKTLTQERSEANGSIEYTWEISKDERVREEHSKLQGKRFKWRSAGSACCGHPSDDVNCRCTARAVYKFIL